MKTNENCTMDEACLCLACTLFRWAERYFFAPHMLLFSKVHRLAWAVGERLGRVELCVIELDGMRCHLVYTAQRGDAIWSADVHTDTRRIAFAVRGKNPGIYVSEFPEGVPQRLTEGVDLQPLFTLDGSSIIYYRDVRDGRGHIMEVQVCTREVRYLTKRIGAYLVTGVKPNGKPEISTLPKMIKRRQF